VEYDLILIAANCASIKKEQGTTYVPLADALGDVELNSALVGSDFITRILLFLLTVL
jgi:hypothetical protein